MVTARHPDHGAPARYKKECRLFEKRRHPETFVFFVKALF
ncbi:hypothetical protein SXCC_04641 [Gluconacetobacter sp. SXCC-1]|nr:hypothetical protein SXCC_04641 [Gluconacetobacter sp. SXCC-1]